MAYRALRLAVFAGAVLALALAGHTEEVPADTAVGTSPSGNSLIAAAIRPSRAFPELRIPGLPHISYAGTFSATGQFRGRSRWDRLRESMETSMACDTATHCGVDPAKLTSQEMEVKDYGSAHGVTSRSASSGAGVREAAVGFLYGRARILHAPEYVAVDSRERAIVSVPGDGVVHVLDPRNRDSFRILGGKEYRLKRPAGVAVDKDDNIYIADAEAGVVLVYDQHGVFLRYIGLWRGENMFEGPTALAIDKLRERIYLADTPRNLIVVLDLNGKQLAAFGRHRGRSTGPVAFDHPTQVVVGDDGVIVLDHSGCRIHKLTLEGRPVYARLLGAPERSEPNAASGIGTDARGNLYITSIRDSAIRIFSATGEFLGSFGQSGTRAGEFRSPRGIYVDRLQAQSSWRVYVADSENNRIQIFQLGGNNN